MQYGRLGSTGLIVSKICLGAGNFSEGPPRIVMPAAGGDTPEGRPAAKVSAATMPYVDPELGRRIIERSLEAGVNFFDSASSYGDSEILLGRLLGSRRQDVVITTKVGNRTGDAMTHAGLSRVNIMRTCDTSLRRLNTDYIDLYMTHTEDPHTPTEETLEALNDLVRAGKVRYIGFSNWSAWKASAALEMQKANGWAQFTCGQMYYSLIGRDVEHDIVPFMLHAGIGMTVWSPLAGGFLSGKYTWEKLNDPALRYASLDVIPFNKEIGFQVVDQVRSIAQAHGASVAQVSLAWLLSKPVVSSIVIGASKFQQLEDNLGVLDLSLSEGELARLDALTAPLKMYPYWFHALMADSSRKDVPV
jgi:aryl-alcohol dehydrogenase-like predicted oxidoreductase